MTLEEAFKKMIQNYFDDDEEDTGTLQPKEWTKERLKKAEDDVLKEKGKKSDAGK